jgi:hypothetical protein
MHRTVSSEEVTEAVGDYLRQTSGLYPEEWVKDEDNWALVKDKDMAMFEKERDGVYSGHYFFQSRGREAIASATSLLRYFLSENKDARTVTGLTPLENLGARWMSRRIGFESHGLIKTRLGPCELFILNRPEGIKE